MKLYKKIHFPTKLPKTGFVPNDKLRQAPGFDLLPHIYPTLLKIDQISLM